MPTQEEAQQKGQQWLNSLGGAKEGGAARKGRGFKAPARAKPPPAMSPREPRRDGAETAPSSREDLKDKAPATGEVLTRTRTRTPTRTRIPTLAQALALTLTLALALTGPSKGGLGCDGSCR